MGQNESQEDGKHYRKVIATSGQLKQNSEETNM
jgi:hypothetical protein